MNPRFPQLIGIVAANTAKGSNDNPESGSTCEFLTSPSSNLCASVSRVFENVEGFNRLFRSGFVTISKTYMKLISFTGTLLIAEVLTVVDEFCGSAHLDSQRGHIAIPGTRRSALQHFCCTGDRGIHQVVFGAKGDGQDARRRLRRRNNQ